LVVVVVVVVVVMMVMVVVVVVAMGTKSEFLADEGETLPTTSFRRHPQVVHRR
jgi:hypothetical protein